MNILLAVTGSIAAYKAANLCRLFKVAGCEVKVIMTPLAKEFITTLTLATLSKNPILVEFFNPENGEWNSHVSLGEWADALVIAPATANTMAKMATGIADNLLLTTYLSARCPVFIAPAMDLDMYAHPTTQLNIETLKSRGVVVVEPESGELASGLIGKGRMAEPEQIFECVSSYLKNGASEQDTLSTCHESTLSGSRFLVTAGATREAIDPVRYITNHSSGKMGYALAEALIERGAEVILVSGATALTPPAGADFRQVESAAQMYDASLAAFENCDGAIMCAAVADYTPEECACSKIKKEEGEDGDFLTLRLRKTRDIAAALGAIKADRLMVGFALETDHEMENAQSKLKRKNLDLIVLNSLNDEGAGFGVDTNRVSLISESECERLALMSKKEVARAIVGKIVKLIK